MAEMPIFPYPDFLSPSINAYIKEIGANAGRCIVFVDLAKAAWKNSQAAIDVPPNLPAAAIFVNKKEINPSLYDPTKHDPLLAHEATHLQLNAEGWDKLEFEEYADDVVKEKVGAIENWLRGFLQFPSKR